MLSQAETLLRQHDTRGAFRQLLASSVFDRLFSSIPGATVAVLEDAHLIDPHHSSHHYSQGQLLQHANSISVGGMMALGGSSSSLMNSTSPAANRHSSYMALQQHLQPEHRRDPSQHPRGLYRRQLVARCRVLRGEIRQFEDEFQRQHGRKPHTSGDRHLHTMQPAYAEYRALKTTVRDNAALHIQVVWKGHKARKSLVANGVRLPKRATRLAALAFAPSTATATASSSHNIRALATTEQQPSSSAGAGSSATSASSSASSSSNNTPGALSTSSAASNASRSFSLGSATGSKPSSSPPSAPSSSSMLSSPSSSAATAASVPASSSSSASSSTAASAAAAAATPTTMSAEHEQSFAKLQALRNEKSTLKAKLRAYDNAFQQEHGRLPSKAEKEGLRPQYLRYHSLKGMITDLENSLTSAGYGALVQQGQQQQVPGAQGTSQSTPPTTTTTTTAMTTGAPAAVAGSSSSSSGRGSSVGGGSVVGPQDSISSLGSRGSVTTNSVMLLDAPGSEISVGPSVVSATASSSSVGGSFAPGSSSSNPRPQSATTSSASGTGAGNLNPIRGSFASANDLLLEAAAAASGGSSSSAASSSGSSASLGPDLSSLTLRELKAEKKRLQAFLRDFEKSFEERHGRKVKFVRDIEGVLGHYSRYKELKKMIGEMEGTGGTGAE